MRCIVLFGLTLFPLCLGQLYERKVASIVSPSWTWGQKIPSAEIILKKIKPKKHTILPAKPFLPFSNLGASAGPYTRNDGTTKSRITKDTLPIRTLADGLEEGFTTLDVLQKEERYSPRNSFTIKGNLGGLDSDEIYYADEDLLIIKGGGFKGSPSYPEPLQWLNEDSREFFYDWRRQKVSSFNEEYNGNIATILAPPVNSANWGRQPSAATQYYPFSLFLPATTLTKESKLRMSVQPQRTLLLTPSNNRNTVNLYFRDASKLNPSITKQNIKNGHNREYVNYSKIPTRKLPQKYTEKRVNQLQTIHHNPSTAMSIRMRETPNNVIINHKIQKHSHGMRQFSDPRDPSSWISLAGDMAVNYRALKPKINPDAELLLNFKKSIESFRPNRSRPSLQNSRPRKPMIKMQPIGVSIQRVKKPRL